MQRIILIITGSIAANKAIELYFYIKKIYQVDLFLTKNAKKFIENVPKINNQHNDWQNADLLIVYPASHNFIAQIANGFSNETCSLIFSNFPFTKMVFPTMNTIMYENKANLRNCDFLKSINVKVFEPKKGLLACKTFGLGRAWEWQEIVTEIELFFKNNINVDFGKDQKNLGTVL